MPNAKEQLQALKGIYEDGNVNFPILGYFSFWNVCNVSIKQNEFKAMLKIVGIDEKYAVSHNYRSAVIRAFRNMEEQRIIRRADENPHCLVYQFTAETKEGTGQDASLKYDTETRIVIDKVVYHQDADFAKCISACREDIKLKVVEHFNEEKTKYKSADITRYIQKIFRDNADLCALRDQGCVYFVPAMYRTIIDKVMHLVQLLGSDCAFDSVPVPDVASSRKVVGNSFCRELEQLFKNLDSEIQEVADGEKDRGQKWADNMKRRISDVKARIGLYADVIGVRASEFDKNFDTLMQAIQPNRELDLT